MAGATFVLATDLRPGGPSWASLEAVAAHLEQFAARSLGVAANVDLACLPSPGADDAGESQLSRAIERVIADDCSELFIVPATFEFTVWQRTWLGEEIGAARLRSATLAIHHDTVDPAHSLIVESFTDQILSALREAAAPPQQTGMILVADGRGDPASRAESYRLMRLLWEQAGLGGGEVGFVRHPTPYLPEVLKQCSHSPREWLLVPHCQWEGLLTDYAGVMLADHQRAHPESAGWRLVEPPRDHPAIRAWLEQRMLRLWQEKRTREAVRVPSAKSKADAAPAEIWSGTEWIAPSQAHSSCGIIGRARDAAGLREILEPILPKTDRYLVKVTWHGYAPGTFTGPAALDQLLGALPGPAVILEGHTSSRNLGGLEIEWEAESQHHRTWIRQQELEFLRRTGLSDVIAKHKAQYVNVTEAWWDGACAAKEDVLAALNGVPLQSPELAEFVPMVLMELRDLPLISFARFKGPTRLGISNLFGLIPHPLRTAWHGAAITDFAAVCCDMARIYGALFPTFGLVEAFESAVRWDRKGLYRSRWGNYDLVLTDGVFTFSEGLPGADILASRLQGQDVSRSSFFGVVRDRLGWSDAAESLPLPIDMQTSLV